MARRLPGSTSTCSASMTSRTRSCETESEFDPQKWWTKRGAILGVAQSPKIQSIKGISEMAMSRLVPLLEFNHHLLELSLPVAKVGRDRGCRDPAGVSRCCGTRLGDFLPAHQLAGRV